MNSVRIFLVLLCLSLVVPSESFAKAVKHAKHKANKHKAAARSVTSKKKPTKKKPAPFKRRKTKKK